MNKLYLFVVCFIIFTANAFAKVDIDPSHIQDLINSIQQNHHLPGVQVGIKDTETTQSWNFSSGLRDTKTLEPLENDHLMQIGSITKSFVASLALLVEADSESGRLGIEFNIDQTIGHWLSQYPEWQSIKIECLLNMTSGIYNYTNEESLYQTMVKDPQKIWSDNELVDLAYFHHPNLLFPSNTKFSYSNTNYIIVGMILEKVTGLPLETLFKKYIFEKYPEYFKHTTYSPKTYPSESIENMAHGYAMHPDGHKELYGRDITEINLSWAGAAGAIVSTAADLVHWPDLLFSKNYLPKKQQEEFQSSVCIESEETYKLPADSELKGYGLGIGRLYDPDCGYIWTHTGGTLGYHSIFFYIPKKSLVISIIVNQIGPSIEGEETVVFILQQIINNLL